MRLVALLIVTAALVATTLEGAASGRGSLWRMWRSLFPRPACRWSVLAGGLFVGLALVALPLAVAQELGAVHLVRTGGLTPALLPAFASSLVVIVGWAALEEFLFRGSLGPWLQQWVGTPASLVLAAVLFAMAHVGGRGGRFEDALSFVVWALDGLAFGCAFVATGALWLPTAVHVGKNVAVWLLVGGSTLAFVPGVTEVRYIEASALAGSPGRAGWLDVGASLGVTLALAVMAVWGRGRAGAAGRHARPGNATSR